MVKEIVVSEYSNQIIQSLYSDHYDLSTLEDTDRKRALNYSSEMHSLRGPLFVILTVLYVLAPGIATNNIPYYYLCDPWAWSKAYDDCRNQNRENKNKICELRSKLERVQTELKRQKNITANFNAELLKRISSSITEQNSLWLKCIAVTPGRQCDITQGCATKETTCRPINV
ncbi:unnamed protein product [Mytilus coruscus]|uniref:Uncharacterized protein n=1 Tax=Mytilus coruscus TaxID=42192 RepID=A0A6J8B110_MYTCO|nr:unnamed protein product [Mytilus coruscus]